MTREAPEFRIGIRGYVREQVDALIERVEQVLTSSNAVERAEMRRRLLGPHRPYGSPFDSELRGYRREDVDAYLRRLAERLG
jgi:DivIVA domain-containing protein